MNAPVATNRWNLALATKKTTSGPSSVASLNSGCGVALSIVYHLLLPSSSAMSAARQEENLRLDPCDCLREITCGERREIVDALADTDEMHRQFVFLGERHQDAAARGAVEFCHHEAGDPCGTMKRLDLRQRILSHRGIEHQQHRMRCRSIDLLDDTHDFFELVHQLGLVLQPSRGIDQQHIELALAR